MLRGRDAAGLSARGVLACYPPEAVLDRPLFIGRGGLRDGWVVVRNTPSNPVRPQRSYQRPPCVLALPVPHMVSFRLKLSLIS